MYLLTTVSICRLLLFLKVANSYVLFAANLEDFRSIAKKFIPERIADKLTQVVSEISLKQALPQNNDHSSISSSESNSYELNKNIYLKGREDVNTKVQNPKFSFEDLVKKVKKRLEQEFKQMYRFQTTKNMITNINDDKDVSHTRTTKVKRTKKARKRSTTSKTTTEDTYIEERNTEKHSVNKLLVNEPPVERQLIEKVNQKKAVEIHPFKKEVKMQSVEKQISERHLSESNPYNHQFKKEIKIQSVETIDRHSFEKQDFKKDVDNEKSKTKQARMKLNIKPFNNDVNNIHPKIKYMNRPEKLVANEMKLISVPEIVVKTDKKHQKLSNKETEEPDSNVVQNSLFEQTYLGKKKDSYEDYVTPERDANIYVSHETNDMNKDTRYKISNNNPKKVKANMLNQVTREARFNLKFVNDIAEPTTEDIFDDYTEKTVASHEIEARTENLWNNENILRNDTDMSNSKGIKTVKKLATHVPKRDVYSVFTPAYVTNATLLVEKYDFNEPIPEKDRVREILKFFGDPVSQVNKKVRLF